MHIGINDTPLHDKLHEQFINARPFPMVVLDNFLPAQVAQALVNEIASFPEFQRSNDYIFAKNKFESPKIEALGTAGRAVKGLFLSEEFSAALTKLYGRPVFVDPDFVGGGLHRGGEGSYLDMHADFSLHPNNSTWIRELNLLLYLNKDWRPEYGGSLDLRNAATGETLSVEPLFNRLVIMLTKDFTLHGYKRINFPPGTFRTSIAAYAYSVATSEEAVANLRTTTTWVPDNANPLKVAVAKVIPQLIMLKQRFFGSTTVRKAYEKKSA
ncbi:MAG TPA: 2OG-Fe(II) oxygenase [Nitrospiraceae bacterium]|nr:2OG-Fe(II) oxygenase [Nitrospiraceae bacterium]